jgi:hypothetical protein
MRLPGIRLLGIRLLGIRLLGIRLLGIRLLGIRHIAHHRHLMAGRCGLERDSTSPNWSSVRGKWHRLASIPRIRRPNRH